MRYEEPEMEIIEFGNVGTTIIDASNTGNGGETPNPDVDLGFN